MSESNPAGNRPRKKEISMEQRLLLAFLLMGVVVLVTPYFMPKPAPAPPKAPPKAAAAVEQKAEPVKAPANPAAASHKPGARPAETAPPPPGRIAADAEQVETVETSLYKIVFSNRGGVVRSWVLKQYQDSTGKPLELLNLNGVSKVGYPFQIQFSDSSDASALNNALWRMQLSADRLRVEFEYSDGGWSARKTFQFRNEQFVSVFSSEVTEAGKPRSHLLAWPGGFGDGTVIGAAASQHSVYYDVNENELVVESASDAKDAPLVHRGNYSFAGIEDQYFAAVAMPASPAGFEVRTLAASVPNALDKSEEWNAGVALGGDPVNRFDLFVGPKDIDLLRRISPRLEQLIDFGWFSFIAKPLFLGIHWLHDRWIPNWGWAIVVITVFINFALLPLKISSLKSMKQMQVLQPQIAAINEKYRGIGMRDPKKQQQNQEVMDLYKKHGVNPVGGCVPMLLQIPFFFAFYKVLSVAIELRGADWLWVTDLSRPETLPIRVLPVAMIATQFILQKMTPSTAADPTQQRIMLMMPLFLGFMFYGVSSGLVLYWLTGNIVGIAQQMFFNRTFHAPAAPVPAKKSSSRK
jgi:YidC/Oxa1 family membrane protein insertase